MVDQKNSVLRLAHATVMMYRECARETILGMYKNWPIIPASLAALFAFVFCGILLTPMGRVGNFILMLVGDALITLYYGWISHTINRSRLRVRDLLEFDVDIFWSIISVNFLLWIALMLISTVAKSADLDWLPLVAMTALFFICNTIPESIYIGRNRSADAFNAAQEFMRKNCLEWWIPLLLVSVLWQVAVYGPFLDWITIVFSLLSVQSFLVPSLTFYSSEVFALNGILFAAVILLGNFVMIFRGFLFKELESGNRRLRAFRYQQR